MPGLIDLTVRTVLLIKHVGHHDHHASKFLHIRIRTRWRKSRARPIPSFENWEFPQHTSSSTCKDLLRRYDGGDGTLSRAELEQMKAHEDFTLLSAVGMGQN